MNSFPEGTVFLTERVEFIKKKDLTQGEVMIVSYSVLDNKNNSQTGKVFVPVRTKEDALRCTPGIMIYKGTPVYKSSGRRFVDVSFLSFDQVEQSLEVQELIVEGEKGGQQQPTKPDVKSTPILLAEKEIKMNSKKEDIVDLLSDISGCDTDIE